MSTYRYSGPQYRDNDNWKAVLGLIIIAIIGLLFIVKISPFHGIQYSEGRRTGISYKLSKKGLIWDTYEGSLSLQLMTRNSEGMMVNQIFNYSVSDPKVAEKIDAASTNNRPVTLYYKQYLFRGLRYGSTSYDIIDVK